MFELDEKHLFPCSDFPCSDFPHPHAGAFPPAKPRYTMTEEVEHTAREMKNTIARLLQFEKNLESKFSDLMKHLTADNVTFKNIFAQAYNTFITDVKNEVNAFESNTDSAMVLFKSGLESDYATLSEDCKKQITEYYNSIVDALNNYKEELNTIYDTFRGSVEDRLTANNDSNVAAFNDYVTNVNSKLATMERTFNANYTDFVTSVNRSVTEFKTAWSEAVEQRLDGQDARIADAVTYMKTNMNASVGALLEEMRLDGSLVGIIDSSVVGNVKQYGAKGDGVTDDTSAFIACIAAHNNIYIPAGNYVISSTIHIEDFRRFTGEGNKTKITFTGTGYLFEVSTYHAARAEFSSLNFAGNGKNNLLRCDRSAWGASVLLHKFVATNFDIALHLVSVTCATVKDGRVYGRNIIESTAGDTETVFSNVNTFENVYFDGNETAYLFTVTNARVLHFNNCIFEHATTAFKLQNKVQRLIINGGWVEGVQYLYSKDDTSSIPAVYECNFVGLVCRDSSKPFAVGETADYGDLVRLYGATGQTALQSALSHDHNVNVCNIYDVNNDLWSALYKFSTKRAFYHAPFNTKVTNKRHTNAASMKYKDAIAAYSNVPVKHDFTVGVVFPDGSKRFYKGGALQIDYSNLIPFPVEMYHEQTWENAAVSRAAVTITNENGEIAVSCSMDTDRIIIIDNYDVLGSALTSNFEI